MNDTTTADIGAKLDADLAEISGLARKFAPQNGQGQQASSYAAQTRTERPKAPSRPADAQTVPANAAQVSQARLYVRARIMEAVVAQSIAAHLGNIQFTDADMARMEEAERQIFGIGQP